MGRKKNNKSKSSLEVFVGLVIFIILLIVVFLNGQNNINQNNEITSNNVNNASTNTQIFEDKLNVYFIDVGQADSILVSNKNETMLIDAGNNENGKNVVNFIKEKGITKINYLIGTHPHADHIGGLDDVINSTEEEYAKSKKRVPASTFLMIRENDNKIVGSINIRWNLNDAMLNFGGHIGYGIRPTERRKGYNKINLYLVLI